jgi:hypothetical protein
MSSIELKKLNHYPDWKTEQGINNVIKYLTTTPHEYPEGFNNKQHLRYDEKFKKDFIVERNILYYRPQTNEDGDYRINLEVVKPNERKTKIKEIYNDNNKLAPTA